MRILIFGDSIAQGFFDSRGGWVQRLINDYHSQTLEEIDKQDGRWIECFNLGISGDTVQGVLDRLSNEVKARQLDDSDDIVVVAIGTNDSILRNNQAIMDVYEFQEILEKLLHQAKDLASKLLLVGLPAVDQSLTDPWAYSSTKKQWHNKRIDVFEDTIKQSAERIDLPFVPVYDRFKAELDNGRELLSDGLHPNEAGHQLILELVKPELEKLLNQIAGALSSDCQMYQQAIDS